MSTIAIGDIHGNLRALEDLLNRIVPHICSDDTVVFLGDYIDRGPDSIEIA
jgi:serine/threonine protein phosphatase 1